MQLACHINNERQQWKARLQLICPRLLTKVLACHAEDADTALYVRADEIDAVCAIDCDMRDGAQAIEKFLPMPGRAEAMQATVLRISHVNAASPIKGERERLP